jgi:hypothetical protein
MAKVMIRADFDDTIAARQVEQVVASIEAQVSKDFPIVARGYVRPS